MINPLLRAVATALHKLLTVGWFFRRPKTYGAHAVALTRGGRLVLVKLWYAPGWRLPGGGRDESEPPTDAALRELREEIGMTSHGAVEPACELEEEGDFKRDTCSLIIVRDVEYRPKRWSWEIEAVSEAPLDGLPSDLSPQTRRWLREVGSRL
ncbi:MAG TPA: NUDIX domain-containing protein [Sphingomicrobium sp.]|nr:NUDIX domain-containing protein [Sphingomicrobium sp.]